MDGHRRIDDIDMEDPDESTDDEDVDSIMDLNEAGLDEIMDGSYLDDNLEVNDIDQNINMALSDRNLLEQFVDSSEGESTSDEEKETNMDNVNPNDNDEILASKFTRDEITFDEFVHQFDTTIISTKAYNVDFNDDTDFSAIVEENEKKSRMRRNKLSLACMGMMGEANIRYAQSDITEAFKICKQIIKIEPRAFEPFKLMSTMYEDMGDLRLASKFGLLACHLSSYDSEGWLRSAHLFRRQGNKQLAVLCYTGALNGDLTNLQIHTERSELLHEMGDTKTAIRGYIRLLFKLKDDECETILQLSKVIAKYYHSQKEILKAKTILQYAFQKSASVVQNVDVNLYLDLLIELGEYRECIDVLVEHCNVKFDMEYDGVAVNVTSCICPHDLTIDTTVKVILILIQFRSFDCIDIEPLLKYDATDITQSIVDIALAFIRERQFDRALPLLLKALNLNSTKSHPGALWLEIALCYKETNQNDKAIEAYKNVTDICYGDTDIKLSLCNELIKLNSLNEAIEFTKLDFADDDNPHLLFIRCIIFMMTNKDDELLEAGHKLLSLSCREVKSNEDLLLIKAVLKRSVDIKDLLPTKKRNSDTDVEEDWSVFVKMCKIYIDRGKYDKLQQLTFSLILSTKFYPLKREQVSFAAMVACLLNNDHEHGFDLLRSVFISKKPNNVKVWNLVNLVTLGYPYHQRIHKYLIRNVFKCPDHFAVPMLHANSCLLSGTYKYALNDYMVLMRDKNDPLLALLIAIIMIQISCQRFGGRKHLLVSEAIAFLWKYKELRGNNALQEVYYNIARAFHQLQLLPNAIHYYKLALQTPIVNIETQNEHMFNLQKECAFNIHLIYLNSGNRQLANYYIRKYIVI